jgi:ankyrin repeat protein
MTQNRKKRQLLHALFDETHLRTRLTSTDLLFILLQKKECELVKKLLKLSPSLIHRLDEDGNDPLLYVCRHRL